jgi:hypothetical protein
MCTFSCVYEWPCARAPCVVLAHADFIVDCIVLGLLEMHFLSMGELIVVWRCWIPVTICGRNFGDNNLVVYNRILLS